MMGPTLIFSAVAAIGVLAVFLALALPKAEASGGPTNPWEVVSFDRRAAQVTLRDRLNRPFQALAERSNRRRRLNGGLTLAENLARADLKLRTSEFVMIQVGFLVGYAALGLFRFGFSLQFIVAGVAGYLIPMRYVKWRQRRRLRDFNKRLPDTLSLLSNGLKAGLSLPQAIEAVARNSVPPISDELARVIRETNLGSSVPEALANMVRRVGSEDLDLIVTAIAIHSSVGGNLARILDTISHTIRQRVQIKGQISALTAQARASGWVITLLPFVVAILLDVIAPGYFRVMLTDRVGQALLGLAVLSILIGNMFVRRITNFRV
jgi:tight adherence protein B